MSTDHGLMSNRTCLDKIFVPSWWYSWRVNIGSRVVSMFARAGFNANNVTSA